MYLVYSKVLTPKANLGIGYDFINGFSLLKMIYEKVGSKLIGLYEA